MSALALYTTIYPGVERYLADWYESVRRQSDQAFRLWIGLDLLTIDSAKTAMGGDPEATWVPGEPGDSPAQIRQRALAQIVKTCDAVVLVDSDDVLRPGRVATARAMLADSDLTGCGLRLVDEQGAYMSASLRLSPGTEPDDVLPRNNIFGLSNSAMRSDLLRRCLPIPAAVELVDWYLVSQAWLLGARFGFDNEVGMDYRQHDANMARVIPPFDIKQVTRDTERVRAHFRILRESSLDGAVLHRLEEVAAVAADIETFHERVVLRPALLERYVRAVNKLETAPLWWSSVANPALRHMWTREEETK